MTVVQTDPNIPQVSVEDPIKSRHNIKATEETIKQMLAGGTPDWVRFPEDYKAFVKESFAAEKENSDRQVAQYRMPDQNILTDEKPRMVNIMKTRDFIKKLQDNGVKCITFNSPLMPQTVGLWCKPPFSEEMKYICYCQIPCQYEWSVLRLDNHGLPAGESYRGWRTVLAQLIVKEILTEQKAHEIFGRPPESAVSKLYRQTLWNFRNGIGRNVAPDEPKL